MYYVFLSRGQAAVPMHACFSGSVASWPPLSLEQSIFLYFILFYFILFYFILFYFGWIML